MATTVGKLRIILTANAGRFTKAMDRAQKRVGTFARAATRFSLKVAGIGTALASLAAGGGMVALVTQAFKAGDALAKTSDKLGLTTEALAGMNLAAELSGVRVQSMQMGLQRMVRRMSEAAIGTGEAQGAIKELGLDAKKLNALAPDEMFREIARAMSKVGNQADRVRLSFKLFDSEGVALVNTLGLGVDKLDEIFARTRKFGTGISRLDAAKLERINDSFRILREYVHGVALQIAVNLSPFINEVTNRLIRFGDEGVSVSRRVADWFTQATAIIGAAWGTMLDISMRAWTDFELSIRRGLDSLITQIYNGLVLGPLGQFVKFPGINKFITDNRKAIASLETSIEAITYDIDRLLDKYINGVGDMKDKFNKELSELLRQQGRSLQGLNDIVGAGGKTGTIQGRAAQQGIIRAGGILGVQRVSEESKNLKRTADNTGQMARYLAMMLRSSGFVNLGV